MQDGVVIDREFVKQHLLQGGHVHCHAWTYMERFMCCSEGCCDMVMEDVEETLDTIENHCDGDYSLVNLEEF